MTDLWSRLFRWWREPRIRLPQVGLRPESVRSGDRLQVGARLWRVSAGSGAPAWTFELTAVEGWSGQARLRFHGGRWAFIHLAAGYKSVIEIDPLTMIHYPVAEHGWSDDQGARAAAGGQDRTR